MHKEVRAQTLEEGRAQAHKEDLQERLKVQRKLLPMMVQSRFPELTSLAKTQARLIKDVTVIEEVMSKVCMAKTLEEASDALASWLPSDDTEEE